MGRLNINANRAAALLPVFLTVLGQWAEPAFSFRLPMGGIASQRRLQEGPGAEGTSGSNQYNVSFVPLLLDLAKEIGRFQLMQTGYFLQNEPMPDYPGIDLRWLLFSQSSPLRVPDGLSLPTEGMPARQAGGPTLLIPSMPDKHEPLPNAEPPLPQLAVSPLSVPSHPMSLAKPRAQIASPEKIRLSLPTNQLNGYPAFITVDFRELSAALTGIGDPDSQLDKIAIETRKVSTSFANPLPMAQPQRTTSTAFMLWTVKSATTNSINASGSKDLPLPDQSATRERYQGTFVACMPGVHFKSIHSQHFDLQQGRIVVGNRGEELVVASEVGDVMLPTGTAAIIDINEKQILKVIALESQEPTGITVRAKKIGGGEESLSLGKGEELVVAKHDLSSDDIAPGDGLTRKQLTHTGNVARNQLTMSQVLERERLLNPKVQDLTVPQRSAIIGLREQVAD